MDVPLITKCFKDQWVLLWNYLFFQRFAVTWILWYHDPYMDHLKANKPDKSYQRFHYVINKRFQLGFVVFMDLVAFLIIGIFYVSNVLFFKELRETAVLRGVAQDESTLYFLANQELTLNRIFAATSFLVIGSLTILGILYSHRIAGPLYRLKKHMDAIAAGEEARPLFFREGDFFQEIPEAYNSHFPVLLQRSSLPPSQQPEKGAEWELKTVA
jgi:hypothetical protein